MKIMAVDLGDCRTGLAVCDKSEILASPLETICENDPERLAQKILSAVFSNEVEMVVVGNPVNMDGSVGERAKKCRKFAEKLEKMLNISVILWDERLTTVAADRSMMETGIRRENRKEYVDEIAAIFILQGYLDYLSNHPEEK